MTMPAQAAVLEPAPLSPHRPAAWTEAIHEQAKQHTAEAFPNEAVGIVEAGAYVRLENRSHDPASEVALSDEELLRVAKAEVFFHSHPNGDGCPSAPDMTYQLQLGIPFVVIVWPYYDVFWWGETLDRQPLLGRGFRHGVHDCFSLIRDYYAQRGTTVMDGARAWEWWAGKEPLNLYMDNLEAAGFATIDPRAAIEPGDALLMAFNYKVPMHGAIVWDRDLLLHHPAGQRPVDPTRLSTLVPRGRYLRHISAAVRRKTGNA